jgi:integrase/recombinase XerD
MRDSLPYGLSTQQESSMGTYHEKLIRELCKTDFSPRTYQSYIREAKRFFTREAAVSPIKTTEDEVTDWLIQLKSMGYAPSTINMSKCALQFFFNRVIPREDWKIFKEFKCGKKNDRRPSLSRREVWKILNSIKTLHNRVALTLIYLCGLRINECVSLHCGDVHRDEGRLYVHRGKGAKSREIPLPSIALQLLEEHWRAHRNPTMIFPAMGRGMQKDKIKTTLDPMPHSSIQKVFNKVAKEVGINKRRLSVHSLRHSYATHLLEIGVPVEHLKVLMGHKRLSTTETYLHITESGFKDTVKKIEKLSKGAHVES